ncbi:MAG: HlyD family type I secretion periplasmic adaptor subunit [Magnetococcales bacterium]|nr:HlyD family type I secretion periplasmic adaptor subunit [Magnetococcales bacterium]
MTNADQSPQSGTDEATGTPRGRWKYHPLALLRRGFTHIFEGGSGRVVPDAIPFQVGIDVIIAENPSFLLMSVFYLMIGMMSLGLLIASLVEVDMLVMATGRLTTDAPPLQLQPMDRAVIRELKVKAGDQVTKGQILATFDGTFAHADLSSLLAQQQATQVRIRRLEHEINNTPFELGSSPNVDERLEYALLGQRQAEHRSRLSMYDEEIERIQTAIQSTDDERGYLTTLLKIYKEVEGMRDTLQKSGTGSQLQYQDSKVARVRTEQSHQDAANRLIQLRHNLASKKAERQTFVEEWTRQLLDHLITARSDISKLNEQVIKARHMSDMEVMTSPVDGVVLDVAKRATGSVLNPAELLITIVPADAVFIAEIMLDSIDVGYVRTDDRVVLKVHAFPYQRHGVLEGKLQFVSQESFQGFAGEGQGNAARSAGGAFHVGRVKLTKSDLEHLPEGARLIRGMTLTADIKVGSRRLISYFLYTFTSMMDESLKER